jgi:uncharacterized membrane protein YkgB
MNCTVSCILAGAFIAASVFVCFRVDKNMLKNPLMKLLNRENQTRYIALTNERRNIYLKGFALGFIISVVSLVLLNKNKMFKLTKLTNICFILAVSFTVNYFFYILHPKSDYMVNHLQTQEERSAWLKIYRTMQFNYHLGFVLGLIGMIFVGNSFC